MKSTILAATFASAFVVLSPSLASAQTEDSTARQICRAAAKIYFFLREMPANTLDKGEYFRFVSDADNVYGCRLSGQQAVFKCLNNYNETMMSNSTTLHVYDDVLIIVTDMKTERFERP